MNSGPPTVVSLSANHWAMTTLFVSKLYLIITRLKFFHWICVRLPLDAYDDGEVSYSLSTSTRRRILFEKQNVEFSDDENDETESSPKTERSIVGLIISSLISVILFPLLVCFKIVTSVYKASSWCLTTISNFTSKLYRSAKSEYNSFMSTNDKSENDAVPNNVERLFVPSSQQETGQSLFTKLCNSIYVFKSTLTSVFSRSASAASVDVNGDESWIEIVVIRRIVRIFR